MFDYKWGVVSPNDPIQKPMRFLTKEDAEKHAMYMNRLIDLWEENTSGVWNKDYWKVKPEPWKVFPL